MASFVVILGVCTLNRVHRIYHLDLLFCDAILRAMYEVTLLGKRENPNLNKIPIILGAIFLR